jgi:minor extracellular protease Epr
LERSSIDYPARFDETISAAAITEEGRIANFSSRGTGLDIAAPGVDILSTYLNKEYKMLSGTSMAAPHVSGAAALLLAAFPGSSPSAIKQRLQRSALPLTGYSQLEQGRGVIDIFRAIGI